MKSDVANTLCAYLEANIGLPFTVYIDLIPTDEEGMCIRHDPAPASVKRFIDGTSLVSWNFSIYARTKDASMARQLVGAVIVSVDELRIKDADGVTIDCEAVSLPQFIDTDAKGLTTYTASFKATYTDE